MINKTDERGKKGKEGRKYEMEKKMKQKARGKSKECKSVHLVNMFENAWHKQTLIVLYSIWSSKGKIEGKYIFLLENFYVTVIIYVENKNAQNAFILSKRERGKEMIKCKDKRFQSKICIKV